VIFLRGLANSLNDNQASTGAIVGMDTVLGTLKRVFPGASTAPSASTRFLQYSYAGSSAANGLPLAYTCVATVTNSIFKDVLLLDTQIKNAFKIEPPGAQVDLYLIGHSLGGVVAMAYMDFLAQGGLGVSLPAGAHLKAVVTMDSPLGGVASGFLRYVSLLDGLIVEQNCPAATGQPHTALDNLGTVFGSSATTTPPEPEDSGTNPQGSKASLLAVAAGAVPALPAPLPSNENLAELAQTNLGTSFLSIGNANDFFFNLHACNPALPDFRSTMVLEDDGDGNGLYGREVVSGSGRCPGIDNIGQTFQVANTNHGLVLNDAIVQQGIQNFLTPLVNGAIGGTPRPLPVNSFQSPAW
jgi:hypothetical protein